MPKQLKTLAVCWLIYSLLYFIGGSIATIVLFTLREDRASDTLVLTILAGIGLVCVAGMRKGMAWAWAGTIALAIVGFTNIPIGPVIGFYTFWVLFKKEVRNYFWAKPAKQ